MPRFLATACALALLPLACTAQSQSPAAGTADSAKPAPSGAAAANGAAPGATAAPKITYSACHVDGPYIAMTFDDGPHAENTPRLLDMLKQRGIKATFFMVGECAQQYPQIVKRIVAEGHEVANHSWSHPLLSKMSDAAVKDQLQKTHDAILNAGGIAPKIMRPPYGGFTERQRRWCNGEFGYKVILWDVDPNDWKYRNAAHVESEILKHTVPGSIVLSHDIHKTTVDAMPATLDALAAKGFKFVTVSELLAMDRPVTPKAKTKAGEKPAEGEKKPTEGETPKPDAAPAPAPAATPDAPAPSTAVH